MSTCCFRPQNIFQKQPRVCFGFLLPLEDTFQVWQHISWKRIVEEGFLNRGVNRCVSQCERKCVCVCGWELTYVCMHTCRWHLPYFKLFPSLLHPVMAGKRPALLSVSGLKQHCSITAVWQKRKHLSTTMRYSYFTRIFQFYATLHIYKWACKNVLYSFTWQHDICLLIYVFLEFLILYISFFCI